MTTSGTNLIEQAMSGDEAAIRELIGQLTSNDLQMQDTFVSALESNSDSKLWTNLLTLMTEGRWEGIPSPLIPPGTDEHRKVATQIKSLFTKGTKSDVARAKENALLSGLKGESPILRWTSAELLGEQSSKHAIEPLISALHDEDERVQWHAAHALGRIGDPACIEPLIGCFSTHNPSLLHHARQSIVAIGRPAISSLSKMQSSHDDQVRLEAIKCLAEIRHPEAASSLVNAAFNDNNSGIRWVASEGLSRLGREGLIVLLHALIMHSDSVWMRNGAHRVFHRLRDDDLQALVSPIINAIEGAEPALEVPIAAQAVLEKLNVAH